MRVIITTKQKRKDLIIIIIIIIIQNLTWFEKMTFFRIKKKSERGRSEKTNWGEIIRDGRENYKRKKERK
jgi:hypothetical protein